MSSILTLAGNNTSTGFYPHTIDQSLRFEDGDSPTLSRTPSGAGNRKTWTWSAWVKRGNITSEQTLFGAHKGANDYVAIQFDANDTLNVTYKNVSASGGSLSSQTRRKITTQVFRDVSSFYHLVVKFDAANTNCDIYVNGTEVTSFSVNEEPQDLNFEVNSTELHTVGTFQTSVTGVAVTYFDGYMSQVNLIDGTALTADSFGELKDSIWVPKDVSGLTYGTNGFHLDFADSSAIGNDVSGQNNDFAVSGLAATDVLPTSPTNTFAVLQPTAFVNIGGANSAQTLSEGNLKFTGTSNEGRSTPATIRVTSGKYYVEATKVSGSGSVVMDFVVNDASVADKSTSTTGDIIIGAVDVDAGKYWSGLNNTWDGSGNPATGANPTGTFTANSSFTFSGRVYNSARAGVFNFGQDSSFAGNKTSGSAGASDANGIGDFYYTPPTDYLTLCSANLPEPSIIDASEYFNTVIWSGNSASSRGITGVSHAPDFVWIKTRNQGNEHSLFDSVRGVAKDLESNSNAAEQANNVYGYITSFDSDGFTVGAGTSGSALVNESGNTFVAWNWKAGGSAVSNTDGTITSSVSASPEAGFSIVSWSGTSSAGTVGHGLGKTPTMYIVKNRTGGYFWAVYHSGLTNPATSYIDLDNNVAQSTSQTHWNSTAPTDTVFSVNNQLSVNNSSHTYIAYCFADIEGYCKAGSYTANNNSDNVYVHLGFRPAWVMCKSYTQGGSGYDWVIYDNKRSPANPVSLNLEANNTIDDESVRGVPIDFLSNGFKIRNSYGEVGSNKGYIYLAFAESPFKYSNAK